MSVVKLAVSAQGSDLDSPLDPRFGRCAYFVVVDTDSWDFEAVPNPAALASSGAGVRAAEHLVSLGIEAVIARDIGPNATRVLDSAGIRGYASEHQTVREAVEAICQGVDSDVGPREATTPMVGVNTKKGGETG